MNQAQSQTPPRKNERWGPEIYLHFEFRFSWGKKDQPPKNHQITYRSRGPRERAPAFPRQVPAPNTNYLAAVRAFDYRQSRMRELRQHYANNDPNRHHQMQEYYQVDQPRTYLPVPVIREPERPTRADAQPSHERGRSAPPPIGENPWDVSVPPLPRPSAGEIRRKPLPAPPSQFRLGEGGQPWSTWSMPVGYDPDTHPKDDEEGEEGARARSVSGPTADRNSTTYATNPTMVSTFSPEPVARARDVETGRARELGALSAAMMTVDNGFENQWWYQGRRETVASASADDRPRTPGNNNDNKNDNNNNDGADDESPLEHQPRWSTGPMTPVTLSPEDPSATPMRPTAGVVSPLTEAALTPAQVPASLLQRTMSTRSEELWFHEKGQ
ncbi:984d269f-1923-4501-b3bb-05c2faa9ad1e [Thermothielavioides terrestris]|uniref:Uncharacterized protein n=2 Tax=Thermothielavioides terrestris TaxID=2587410 RepID=G2R6R6_THETT|nr:uncharacterized protein THITE_2116595 [Thermothielavioides terrestris NRRL 8126]AEO67698.1 hypothetical protein THITE_2116595 [Thermothielavioides terrestris NRRL 8126]SPQ25825.1 984d269f-1923-4501-b3bb-05c2faa9ad1e [Thermothielavioides terrestris]